MSSVRFDRRVKGRHVLMPLIGFILLSIGSCRGCQKEHNRTDEISPHCGECLDLPTGEVCTAKGTVRNSCLAICLREKILCSNPCPCPSKKDRKD